MYSGANCRPLNIQDCSNVTAVETSYTFSGIILSASGQTIYGKIDAEEEGNREGGNSVQSGDPVVSSE